MKASMTVKQYEKFAKYVDTLNSFHADESTLFLNRLGIVVQEGLADHPLTNTEITVLAFLFTQEPGLNNCISFIALKRQYVAKILLLEPEPLSKNNLINYDSAIAALVRLTIINKTDDDISFRMVSSSVPKRTHKRAKNGTESEDDSVTTRKPKKRKAPDQTQKNKTASANKQSEQMESDRLKDIKIEKLEETIRTLNETITTLTNKISVLESKSDAATDYTSTSPASEVVEPEMHFASSESSSQVDIGIFSVDPITGLVEEYKKELQKLRTDALQFPVGSPNRYLSCSPEVLSTINSRFSFFPAVAPALRATVLQNLNYDEPEFNSNNIIMPSPFRPKPPGLVAEELEKTNIVYKAK